MVSGNQRSVLQSALAEEVTNYRHQTFAISTRRAYRTHRDSYLAFCNCMGYTPVPATTETLCHYAALLARSLKYNSIKQYLNIVRILHLEWGFPNPLLDNFHLRCVLQGIRRQLGDVIRRKLPITPPLLKVILSKLDIACALDSVVWAACLTLFFGLLRRSNLMPRSPSSFDTSRHLRRQDITFHPWGARLHIRWTKTIQYGERCLSIPLPRLVGNVLCPVAALFRAVNLTASASPDGPALVLPSSQGFPPLTSRVFVNRVRECLQAGQVDPVLYSGHSFRRGGATWAYKVGVDIETIRQLGDWRSTAFRDYVMIDNDTLVNAVKQMQSALLF